MQATNKAAFGKARWMRRGLVGLFAVLVTAGAVIGIASALRISTATSSANVMNTSHLPFGPGLAATYGNRSEGARTAALPFGPQIAASYGKPNDASAAVYALPFGPGLAATYGTRGEGTRTEALPFGPQIAASYGKTNDALASIYALPFGPGWAVTYGVPAR